MRISTHRNQIVEAFLRSEKQWLMLTDTEEKDERPHCEEMVSDGEIKPCGSERGLKRIKYHNGVPDRTYCPKHFEREWGQSDASEAEPVKTAKDDK